MKVSNEIKHALGIHNCIMESQETYRPDGRSVVIANPTSLVLKRPFFRSQFNRLERSSLMELDTVSRLQEVTFLSASQAASNFTPSAGFTTVYYGGEMG